MARGVLAAVSGCFLLSGFAALIYQTAWTREFAFVFGTSEQAVAMVLSAYMGGLAAGSAVAARFLHRVTRPVLWYAILEGAIALCAFAVPEALTLSTRLYVAVFGGQPMPPDAGDGVLTLYTLVASMGILLVPTALMGATLPLLIRSVVDRDEVVGSRVGFLYAINTLGAVFGTVVAGFVLLPTLGLRGTLWVAVATNGLVFVLAALVARAERTPPRPAPGAESRPRASWILPTILLSGFVSFGYEVLWFKLLVHLVGASVHAFSTMLASFLIGIALGSTLASPLARDRRTATRGFAVAQIGVALASAFAYVFLDSLPGLAARMDGDGSRRLIDAGLSVLVLLPSTLCIGATFPFAVRILARDETEAGGATARVYAWNTLGAIAGAVGTGFVLLPWLGFAGMLTLLLATGLVLAFVAALATTPRLRIPAAVAVALGASLLVVRPEPPWELLRTGPLTRTPQGGEIVFHEVGRSTTVMVRRLRSEFVLSTSGLPEASVGGTLSRTGKFAVARWLGAVGALARPEGESMLMVGLGGGLAIEAVPQTIRELHVVELEPAVVAANRFIAPDRARDPLSDPRVRVIENDARAAMALTERRYDVVASQPSHPWTAGASNLYTREFFELVKQRLVPGGVFVQWMGLNFIDLDLLGVLLATLLDTFEHVQVYQPEGAAGIQFVASDEPLDLVAGTERALARDPETLASIGIHEPADVEVSLVLDSRGAKLLAAGATINRDRRNRLQTRSPGVIGRSAIGRGLGKEIGRRDAIGRVVERLGPQATIEALWRHGHFQRLSTLSSAIRDRGWQAYARGLIASSVGDPVRAVAALSVALRERPGLRLARARLLELGRADWLRRGETPPLLEPLRPPERDWLDAARALADAGAPLDPGVEARLAAIDPADPMGPAADRLRAESRLREDSGSAHREALALIDGAGLRSRPSPADVLLRARLTLALGDVPETLQSVHEVVPWAERRRAAVDAAAFLELLEGIEDERAGALRSRLQRIASGA